MAEIVHLKPGESPPEHQDWVLVVPAPSGAHDISMVVAHSRGATYYYDTAVVTLELALTRATAWADQHNIAAVHVQGAFHA